MDKKNYLPIVLVALTLLGLIIKLLLAFNITLNSDSVVPGLQAIEIFKHGNTFLDGFYYPENYPAIFTDLLPFQLIPQLLTNYDPDALRLTSYLIFVLIVSIYTALIYKVSKDQVKSLLFLALLSNITPNVYSFFVTPVAHGATILITGVLLFLLLDYEKLSIPYKVIMAIIVFLIALSDNLFLAILAIPFGLSCIYIAFRKNTITSKNALIPAFGILLPAIIASAIKPLMPSMVSMNINLIDHYLSQESALKFLSDKSLLLVHDAIIILNDQLFSLYTGDMSLWTIFGSLTLVILIIFAIKNVWESYKNGSSHFKMFVLILLISDILILLGFAFTSLNAPRYLLFLSISAFAIMALGYNENKIYLALAIIVILQGMVCCMISLSHINTPPNQVEYDLIDHLKENNLTTGYSDYWNSNLLTYLSHEQVTVRAIGYKNGQIVPYALLSDSKWYADTPDNFFIVYHIDHDYGSIGAISSELEWARMEKYGDYYIFIYEMENPPITESPDMIFV